MLALDGIRRLDHKLSGIIEAQQSQQAQINDLRNAYTRTAPMGTVQLLEQNLTQQLAAMNLRVTSLESGTLAAVLARLEADAAQRVSRQADTDRSGRLRTALLVLVLVGLVFVAALEIWVVLT